MIRFTILWALNLVTALVLDMFLAYAINRIVTAGWIFIPYLLFSLLILIKFTTKYEEKESAHD